MDQLCENGSGVDLEAPPPTDCDFVDVPGWVASVKAVLREGWQQYERFRPPETKVFSLGELFDGELESTLPGGDLAARADWLWMEFDFLKRDQLMSEEYRSTAFELWSELEHHLDPQGELQQSRRRLRRQQRAERFEAEGRADLAAEWRKEPDAITPSGRTKNAESFEQFVDRLDFRQLRRWNQKAIAFLRPVWGHMLSPDQLFEGADLLRELSCLDPCGAQLRGGFTDTSAQRTILLVLAAAVADHIGAGTHQPSWTTRRWSELELALAKIADAWRVAEGQKPKHVDQLEIYRSLRTRKGAASPLRSLRRSNRHV